jgi:hypothetical protein
MVYDPATTFVIYMVAIGVLFGGIAAVADLWTAKAERDARRRLRDQARAARRAKPQMGEEH